ALHEAAPHRIRDSGEHHRERAALAPECRHRYRTEGKDRIRLAGYEFNSKHPVLLGVARGPAFVDVDIAADLPAQLVKPLAKGGNPALRSSVASNSDQHADPSPPLSVLRAPRERPCCRCTANERDELATPHSITSSAATSSLSGTVR